MTQASSIVPFSITQDEPFQMFRQCMVPKLFNLRPHYHKQEVRFLLYILGQVVT